MFDLTRNHFELFGLPVAFDLDAHSLAERYHRLRQSVHPDRYASASEREKRLSLQASTLVNEAYQTLRDPLARARYLLWLKSGEPGNDQKTTKDMAFLLEQMELREALAESRRAPDPYGAIEGVRDRLAAQSQVLLAQLPVRLAAGTPADLEEARELVRKLQFVRKCEAEAEAIEAELDETP